jgi:transposase
VKGKKPPPQKPAERDAARRAVDTRIDAIVALMEAGKWRAGLSHNELAARFGVSVDTIYEDARAAGAVMRRFLALTPEERQAAKAQLLADLEEHRAIALRTVKPVTWKSGRKGALDQTKLLPHPDLGAANEALQERAKIFGLYAPAQVEVTGPPPELERLTLEELEQLDAEIGRRRALLQARIAELRKKPRS